jgi:hypothetical protein
VEPSAKSKKIVSLPWNTKVSVIRPSSKTDTIDGIIDYWYKIDTGEEIGWAFGGYLIDDNTTKDLFLGEWHEKKNWDFERNWLKENEVEIRTDLENSRGYYSFSDDNTFETSPIATLDGTGFWNINKNIIALEFLVHDEEENYKKKCYISIINKNDIILSNISNGDELHILRYNRELMDMLKNDNIEDTKNYLSHININEYYNQGATPLMYAIYAGNYDIATFLIQAGSNVNAADLNKLTPLHYACSDDCTFEMIQLLVEHGANVNAQDDWQQTPLDFIDYLIRRYRNKEKFEIIREYLMTKDAENNRLKW